MTALTVTILAEGFEVERPMELSGALTYEGLFEVLEINPETVVALRNGHPVPADELVEDGDLKIIRVVSSG